MVGMKVNNLEAWDRVKAGELKGFSVESIISLEEFSKEELNSNNNMDIKTDEMFWTTLKNTIKEIFSSSMIEKQEPAEIEPINEDLEEQTPASEPVAQEEPKVESTPVVEEPKVEEPKAEEPKQEEEPKVEEPKDNHLEELINSLKEEIAALKTSNGELQEKLKDMGKQPSAAPVNVNAKSGNVETGVGSSTYQQWRQQMEKMMMG